MEHHSGSCTDVNDAAESQRFLDNRDIDSVEHHQHRCSTANLDSSGGSESSSVSEAHQLARLALMLSTTFCLSMLPLLVTELARNSVTSLTYVNVHTFCLAVSSLQTVVYPQLLAWADHVVHRSLKTLHTRLYRVMCYTSH